MPYNKTGLTSFRLFTPPIGLREYIETRHDLWRIRQGYAPQHEEPHHPAFDSWCLTNLWRELDRTTCYVINEVLPRFPTASTEQVLEVAAFRSLGKIETDKAITKRFGTWNDAVAAGWDAMYTALPSKPLTGAYARMVGIKKALNAGPIIKQNGLDKTASYNLQRGYYDVARNVLAVGTYLGRFVATQVVYDITWRGNNIEPWEGDTWLGPGAAHGLGLALNRECLTWRRGNPEVDRSAFREYELHDLMYEFNSIEGPYLWGMLAPVGLRELENVLCEYSRICRLIVDGRVPALRLYHRNLEPFHLPPGWS